jgi:tetratricopeptide (TPR) repeat protein
LEQQRGSRLSGPAAAALALGIWAGGAVKAAAQAPSALQGGAQAVQTAAAALTQTGESEQARGQTLVAEESFRRAYALDTANLPAITHLAALLEQEKQTTAAVGFWRVARGLRPDDAGIRFSLATALLAAGADAEAATLFRSLLKQKIEDRGAVLVNLGTALARSGSYEEAAAAFEQALVFPEVAETARLSLVKALCTLLRYAQAQPYARQYLGANPQSYDALYFMGLIDSGLGDGPAAVRELQAAVAADPKQFDGQLQLGEALRHTGDAAGAIAALQAATLLKPESKDAHFQLARACSATGQTAKAEQQYAILKQLEQASAVQTQVTVLDNQAGAALARHDTAGAAAAYGQIEKLEAGNAAGTAKVLYDLAMLNLQDSEPAKARARLEQAHTLSTAMPQVNAELGYLDMLAGNLTGAEGELEAALKADPQSSQALGNLGVLDAKIGRPAEAIRNLQLAVEADPAYARGYVNLGLVLAGIGRYAAAESALQKAEALAPGDAVAARALRMVREKIAASYRAPGAGR